ncbi:MAG: single-stranded DNA-binding protein [bacterium]|nr:single-stranded DNA-binding protein [bacterium]
MTLAKAVVTGTVYREPEKRFSQTGVPVSSFVLNIGDREEMLLRVISRRTALDEIVSQITKSEKVLVEGSLQVTSVKSDNGTERRIFEIDASTVEIIGQGYVSSPQAASSVSSSSKDEEIVKFSSEELSNELIGEDEIPF